MTGRIVPLPSWFIERNLQPASATACRLLLSRNRQVAEGRWRGLASRGRSLPLEHGLALLHERGPAFDVVLAAEAGLDQLVGAGEIPLALVLDGLTHDEFHRL